MADVHSFQPTPAPAPFPHDDLKKPHAPFALSVGPGNNSFDSLLMKDGEDYDATIRVESRDVLPRKFPALSNLIQDDSVFSTDSDSEYIEPSATGNSQISTPTLSPSTSATDLKLQNTEGYFGRRELLHTPPPQTDDIEVFQEEPQTKDIKEPIHPLNVYIPPGREKPPISDEPKTPVTATPEIIIAVEAPISALPQDTEPSRRWWQISLGRNKASIDKPVTEAVDSPKSTLILPYPPRDDEKFLYAQTRRVALYIFGTISFISISAGMWLFTISSKNFYWFGVFFGFVEIYLLIFFIIGYVGKDFDTDEHKQLVEEHSYPSDKLPLIDIYLPCCHEPLEILENTYIYVSNLSYPNFKVYVLDDGGLDSVKALAESYGFNYITRDNKPHLKKAGNLRYAFTRTEGEFFAIFDADFCPRADFCENILPYMNKYKDIAIVQSPQFFRPSPEQTWVEQGASSTQELFYRVVQVNRDRWGGAICVGSNAVYRREALVDVGGTAEIGHSEDVHTGFYAITRGWRIKYIPLALACGISPDTPPALFSQQMRWCSGSTSLLINSDFWVSNLTIVQKICYLSGMMFYASSASMAFLNVLPGIFLVAFNPKVVMWYNCAFVVPSLIYSIIIFRMWSRQKYNFNVTFVFAIQQYAYIMAIKDRIFNTTALWVPSGDNKAHGGAAKKKSSCNKYRNMRIFCAAWLVGSTSAMIVGVTFRIIQGYHWYHFFPILLLDAFSLFIAHKFIFYTK